MSPAEISRHEAKIPQGKNFKKQKVLWSKNFDDETAAAIFPSAKASAAKLHRTTKVYFL